MNEKKTTINYETEHLLFKPMIIPGCATTVLMSDCCYNKLPLI